MERRSPEADWSACDGGVELVIADAAQRRDLQEQVLVLQRKVDNLMVALASQRMIGMAVGIVAQRSSCSVTEAWERLTRLSQDTNIKVRELARVIIDAVNGTLRDEDSELLDRLGSGQFGGPWR